MASAEAEAGHPRGLRWPDGAGAGLGWPGQEREHRAEKERAFHTAESRGAKEADQEDEKLGGEVAKELRDGFRD